MLNMGMKFKEKTYIKSTKVGLCFSINCDRLLLFILSVLKKVV